MKNRAPNPAYAFGLCYAAMVCLAIAVNLMPIFLTTLRVDLGGKDGLSGEQLGRISAVTFTGLVGGILFTGPLADRWGGKLFSIFGTLLIGVGLGLLAISPGYSMVLVAVFVMGLGAGILDMVLSPIIAALQPDNRAVALNWLHSFYGIGTVVTVVIGTIAFRLGIGWRTISLMFITVPLLVALGFLNVDLPPLISEKEGGRTPMRDLYRNSSFVAVNVAIFLGGALELGLAQWLPAYAEMSLGFSKLTGGIALLAFSAAMALGRIFAGLIGRRVDPIRLMLGCCWTSVVLFLLACFAPWPTVALSASVAVGLAGSCLWPTTLGAAADRFPRGGATMFGLLAAFGNLGGIFMPWLVGVTSDWSSLRLGLATSTACPLLMAFVLLWMQGRPVAESHESPPVAQNRLRRIELACGPDRTTYDCALPCIRRAWDIPRHEDRTTLSTPHLRTNSVQRYHRSLGHNCLVRSGLLLTVIHLLGRGKCLFRIQEPRCNFLLGCESHLGSSVTCKECVDEATNRQPQVQDHEPAGVVETRASGSAGSLCHPAAAETTPQRRSRL